MDAESTSFSYRTLDADASMMRLRDMLDDGKPQPGAPGRRRAAVVDTVKSLGEAGNMHWINAPALIVYR